MVAELMTPSTVSLAIGDGDQVTLAVIVIVPASTLTETVLGQKTVGGSLSALGKRIKTFLG